MGRMGDQLIIRYLFSQVRAVVSAGREVGGPTVGDPRVYICICVYICTTLKNFSCDSGVCVGVSYPLPPWALRACPAQLWPTKNGPLVGAAGWGGGSLVGEAV